MTAAGIGAIASMFYFTQTMLNKERKWLRYALLYSVVSMILGLFTGAIIQTAAMDSNVLVYQFSPWVAIFAGPAWLILIYSAIDLIIEFRKTSEPIRRNRLVYFMVGILFILLGTILNFTVLGKYPVDIVANGVTALLIAYAILRYQLLDIRVVIRKGLVYSIPTILIGSTYFLVISLALNLLNLYSGTEIFLLSLGVAVITALIAEPLRLQAQNIIDRLFFREKYDSRLMLQTLSGRVASILDLYEITNMILHEVASTLHIPKAAFFLREEESGRFLLTSQIGLENLGNLTFRREHPLVLWLSTHEQSLTKHDLEVHPQFRSLWKSERQDLEELDVMLLFPIKVQRELVGIFSIGPKRSEQAYTEDDKLTLLTLANQTAVAIENARLYTSEQNRRKEIDTLYNLARQLVVTNDLTIVYNHVSRHAVETVHVAYSRILISEENGDFYCRATYPKNNRHRLLGLGKIEPIVAEHYYNWILRHERTVVIKISDKDLRDEEKRALFLNNAHTLCLVPLIGVDEYLGLLVLGDSDNNHKNPFDAGNLRLVNAISDHATSAIQRANLHKQLEDNFLQTVISLANAMDARDSYTGDHSQRMGDLATQVSQAMNLSAVEVNTIYWAAVLHDIGKIGIPDKILNKPGPLTKKEWTVIKEHPLIGAQIVAPVKYLASVSPIIRSHHEKVDGSGYPDGLAGDDIPLGSRIVAVVDAYVAIRDERVYRKSRSHEEAIAELRRCSGTQFDPDVVDVFCKIITG